MGMNTVVHILNDAWHEIEEDPDGFVAEIEKKMNNPDLNSLNYIKVMLPHHSSEYRAYVSGGNTIVDPARIPELLAKGLYDYVDKIICELEHSFKAARSARDNYIIYKDKEPSLYKAKKVVKNGNN